MAVFDYNQLNYQCLNYAERQFAYLEYNQGNYLEKRNSAKTHSENGCGNLQFKNLNGSRAPISYHCYIIIKL